MEKRYYRDHEIAKMLDIHPRQARKLAAQGKLPSVKIGKTVRFPIHGIEVALERNEKKRRKSNG
ncbi:MAG: helix-turn-helix domain-containing protein [candidate division NC10 bacterium]|nr:helix-turn-helix domain-containing protein [candidate division NC10 bacterium]